MILDTTTRKLQISLASAPTTQASVIVDYVDFTSTTTTPDVQLSTTNGTTPVDILSAPAASTQRKVNSITIYNNDAAVIIATIFYDDNGTDYNIIKSMTIGINGTLQYTDRDGWSLLGSTGGLGNKKSTWVQEFTSNGTWTKPSNCRFFLVEAVGGGGGGGGNTNAVNFVGGAGGNSGGNVTTTGGGGTGGTLGGGVGGTGADGDSTKSGQGGGGGGSLLSGTGGAGGPGGAFGGGGGGGGGGVTGGAGGNGGDGRVIVICW